MMAQQLRLAAALADVPIEASCFSPARHDRRRGRGGRLLRAVSEGARGQRTPGVRGRGCSNQTTLPVLSLVAPQR